LFVTDCKNPATVTSFTAVRNQVLADGCTAHAAESAFDQRRAAATIGQRG
jgi:hypothetical protein